MLPTHIPRWLTVYWWFRRLVYSFLFQVIHDLALMLDRQAQGREKQPSAAVIDSQTVKAPRAARRGYDTPKRVTGRKRHIAVDADGRLLMARLTPADLADSTGAVPVLDALEQRWPWVKHLFADGAYYLRTLLDRAVFLDFVVEVVCRLTSLQGSAPLRRHWVVDRTFGWMMQWRRLVRDYELRLDVSTAMNHVALGSLLLQRLLILK